MKRLPGKILALIITISLLSVGTVTANGRSMHACCVQAKGHKLQSERKITDYGLSPGCCTRLKNFSCQLMSDLAPQVWGAAIIRVVRGENLTKFSAATAATGVFGLFHPASHVLASQRLLTTASRVALYLRNLSLLM